MVKYVAVNDRVEKGIVNIIIISTTNEIMITFKEKRFTDEFIKDLSVNYKRRSETKITFALL